MRRPTETTERDRALSADEIRTMWGELADAKMLESTRDIVRLCLITGQRVGEICGMDRREIDLEQQLWTIPASRTKNSRSHIVPLSNMATAIIRGQIQAAEKLAKRKEREVSPFIFPAPGGRASVSGAAIAKAVKRQEAAAKGGTTVLGVSPWTPHDLRRTAATMMEEMGVSPFVVGHVLNHISITKSTITSRVYARYDYAREKREALALWADRLAAIIEEKGNVVSLKEAAA
jgi:integrase